VLIACLRAAGLTIAQISDIHVGPSIRARCVLALVDRAISVEERIICKYERMIG